MKTYNKNLDAASPLTLEQRLITQQTSMERSFQKQYWDNKEPRLYVDVLSGKPLFASTDRFDGGTSCRSRPQSRSPFPSPISREECREPLYCRCIRLSVPCGLEPDRPFGGMRASARPRPQHLYCAAAPPLIPIYQKRMIQ